MRGTLLCFALLFAVIAFMYLIQPPVVHSFMSFGFKIDNIIVRVSSLLATGFAIAVLALELYRGNKGKRRK